MLLPVGSMGHLRTRPKQTEEEQRFNHMVALGDSLKDQLVEAQGGKLPPEFSAHSPHTTPSLDIVRTRFILSL